MEPADQLDVVLLPVCEELHAVPIGWVREVVTAPSLTRLVTAPPMVLGLFNLRGEIVPLLDTASLLGIGRAGPVAFAVVLDTLAGIVALSADGFPTRRLLDTELGASEVLGGRTFRVDERLVVLVDVPGILASAAAPAPQPHPGSVPSHHTLAGQS
jgi:chemotaxis signal transduction protein